MTQPRRESAFLPGDITETWSRPPFYQQEPLSEATPLLEAHSLRTLRGNPDLSNLSLAPKKAQGIGTLRSWGLRAGGYVFLAPSDDRGGGTVAPGKEESLTWRGCSNGSVGPRRLDMAQRVGPRRSFRPASAGSPEATFTFSGAQAGAWPRASLLRDPKLQPPPGLGCASPERSPVVRVGGHGHLICRRLAAQKGLWLEMGHRHLQRAAVPEVARATLAGRACDDTRG